MYVFMYVCMYIHIYIYRYYMIYSTYMTVYGVQSEQLGGPAGVYCVFLEPLGSWLGNEGSTDFAKCIGLGISGCGLCTLVIRDLYLFNNV